MKIKDKILSETSEEVKQRVRDTANKLVMKQETLEDKLKSLVEEWRKRQEHYIDVAYKHVDNAHNNRKFTYKAMATRDCWKELLKLIKDGK